MRISEKEYKKAVKKFSPNSPKIKDFVFAYLIGGLICVLGQMLFNLFLFLKIDETLIKMLVPCSLIFLSVVLTGLEIYQKIAKHAGAGTLVPITGFANAVASAAIEFKNEGRILGIGTKIFTVAGPVVLYGTVASVVYGIIYYIFNAVI